MQLSFTQPLTPHLFRCLAACATHLRQTGLADGAVSSYASLAAYWDAPQAHPQAIVRRLREIALAGVAGKFLQGTPAPQTHRVAVSYRGPDLAAVAEHCGCSQREVIRRHRAATYTVAAVGFLPHFGYLWGMDPRLATPRRASPRTCVPAGSLGIAGQQTGVYPRDTPGGWQLIGRVDPALCRDLCPKLRVGDQVCFEEAAA